MIVALTEFAQRGSEYVKFINDNQIRISLALVQAEVKAVAKNTKEPEYFVEECSKNGLQLLNLLHR